MTDASWNPPPAPASIPDGDPATNLPPVPQPKRGWSRGDFVLRGLLAVLSLLLLLEWTSQRNYGTTLEDAAVAIETAEGRGLTGEAAKTADIVAGAHGWFWESSEHAGHLSVTELRWPSLFKDYRIRILTDDEGSVMALKTANPEPLFPDAETEEPAPELAEDLEAGPTQDGLPVPELELPASNPPSGE